MGFFSRIFNAAMGRTQESMSLRRWEAARRDRLNNAHWQDSNGETVNQAIQKDRDQIVKDVIYESANNPFLEGVINDLKVDIVGPAGPSLQVQTERKGYGDRIEREWKKFWAKPDVNGIDSGTSMLQMWVRNLFQCGEFIIQITPADPEVPADHKIGFRLHDVHPRRLENPGIYNTSAMMFDGVEVNKTGRPVGYYLKTIANYESMGLPGDYLPVKIPAKDILHRFVKTESGQQRGYPWFASALPAIASCRDLDGYVMEAAKQAAVFGVLLSSTDPNGVYLNVNDSTEMEPGRIATMPPGWTPTMISPTQPAPNYVEFRSEKHREIGRPVGMPLMMVRHDSSNHNYSSARFDGQRYWRGIAVHQAWLARETLRVILLMVIRELTLMGEIPKEKPEDLVFAWTWPTAPHVDPAKEANAVVKLVDGGTITVGDAVQMDGREFDTHIAKLAKEIKSFEAVGLTHPFVSANPSVVSDPNEAETGNIPPNNKNAREKTKLRAMIEGIVQEAIEESIVYNENTIQVPA